MMETNKPLYSRYHILNPFLGVTFDIEEMSEEELEADITIQAVDGGGEALARATQFTLIMCSDADGTPSAETFRFAITGGGDGQILTTFGTNAVLCLTSTDGTLNLTVTASEIGTYYFGLVTEDGLYETRGDITILGASQFSGTLSYFPVVEGSFSTSTTCGGARVGGADDEEGAIEGTGITAGTLNYTNGNFTLDFDVPVDDEVDVVASYDYVVADEAIGEGAWTDELTYSGTTEEIPIVSATFEITVVHDAATVTASANGAGVIGAVAPITGGTIDTVTGEWAITVSENLDDSTDITAAYDHQVTAEAIGTGNGLETSFSGTLANIPIVATSLTITAPHAPGTLTVTSTAPGVLEGDGDGTIDYDTGEWAVVFDSAPDAAANNILATYQHAVLLETLATVDLPEETSFPSLTTAEAPIRPGSVVLTYTVGGVEQGALDDGEGAITSDEIDTATVNYETGEIAITFLTGPDDSTDILATYNVIIEDEVIGTGGDV